MKDGIRFPAAPFAVLPIFAKATTGQAGVAGKMEKAELAGELLGEDRGWMVEDGREAKR